MRYSVQNANGVASQRGHPFAGKLEALIKQRAGFNIWPDAEHSRLVSDYIEWISPSLPTLQHLNRAERARLEKKFTFRPNRWNITGTCILKSSMKIA